MKTNAMRVLDSLNINYEILTYEWDEEHLDAIHASESLGLNPEAVFKTIVMIGKSNNLYVFTLPALFNISLKKARDITREKEIDLLPLNLLQKNTGYIRGGCSPIAMIKKYPVYIEETALLEEYIYFSAGVRGMQIKAQPEDLRRATDGTFVDFV